MNSIGRLIVAAVTLLALASARADEAVRPPHQAVSPRHACLDQKDRRAAIESGRLIGLVAAMRAAKKRMAGAVVRARLCRGHDEGLVYVLTVLARNGKVARLTVDAVKGTLVGER